MEQACEKQDSVCNLVAVFENNRYRWWGRGRTLLSGLVLWAAPLPRPSIMGAWQYRRLLLLGSKLDKGEQAACMEEISDTCIHIPPTPGCKWEQEGRTQTKQSHA